MTEIDADKLNSLAELLDLLESRGVAEFSGAGISVKFSRGFVPATGAVMTRETEGTMPLAHSAKPDDLFSHPSLWSSGRPDWK